MIIQLISSTVNTKPYNQDTVTCFICKCCRLHVRITLVFFLKITFFTLNLRVSKSSVIWIEWKKTTTKFPLAHCLLHLSLQTQTDRWLDFYLASNCLFLSFKSHTWEQTVILLISGCMRDIIYARHRRKFS